MPACSTYSPDLKKNFDYFQRKKVGSIRDNPKLLKIRQQFENASQETSKKKDLRKDIKWPDSAPSSFSLSLSKSSGTVILDELLKINSTFSSKTESFLKSQLDNTQNRRHSEGEVEDRHSLTLFTCNSSSELAGRKASENKLGVTSLTNEISVQNNRTSGKRSPVGTKSFIPSKSIQKQKNIVCKRDNTSGNSSSESGVHTNSSASEEENITAVSKNSAYQMLKENSIRLADNQKDAPPIPKRGLSPAVQNNFSCLTTSRRNLSKVPQPLSKEVSTSQSLIKANSVQKAIQIYEGMSSNDVKKNKMVKNLTNQKVTPRKDIHDNIRRSGIPRRSSRRNSMRKSKCLSDKDMPKTSPVPKTSESKTCREDSGIIVSDTEDKNQSIYQTLSTVVNISQGQYDPYDRLSRIHDVMNRIHKGQSSTCAACKAIPSSVLQYRTDESSFLQVKCNEAAPHHHPPCICFSCQHSIFSCSLKSEASQPDHVDEENLYYNVCCLNSPNRESWRQSRRRPVCEQNGRLCIVNCDMEQHSGNCDLSKSSEEFYEKLSEWHSTPADLKRRHPTKQISGDSCDSDEGWVDVTDSEDEKPLLCDTRHLILSKNNINFCKGSDGRLTAQNIAYDLDQIVSKCENLDISRSSSTEHLYESIADLDNQNGISNSEENILRSSNGSSTLSLKSEQNPENEFDSGEWSTESASPIFDESSNKENLEQKSSTISNQYRFAVNSECQETAKKNFMKSVLGKKVVNPKKRRMSTFFVPWLVSNQEYGSSSSRNSKSNNKKQNSHSQTISSKASPCKNKRSQSIPSSSPKLSMSCTKALFSSAEVLDKYKDKSSELDNCSRKCLERSFCLNSEAAPPGSSRGSVASSAYLRADQLQTTTVTHRKASISTEATVDVNIERVCRPSTSGDSEHSYILFQPIKEEEVPLYQFYERNIKERVSFCRSPSSMSPVMWSSTSESGPGNDLVPKTIRPTLSVVEQLSPDAKDMKMLWCELPEVKESGILERISAQELKLQEAAFEFIQSQASYIRSLKVLYENFIKTPEFSDIESSSCVLSKHEHDVLFSDIIRVKEVSESLMCELTARWSDGILIPDICDIIHRHAVMPSFSVYVRYCSNRVYQERTLKELKETRLCFLEVLRKLESNPACQGLSLESFLFLPMQHIARLPLLLDNIFRWIVPESPSYSVCKMALEAVHKIFVECNEGARKMERLEEMFVLNKQLEFKDCKVIPLISASRWLLKKGELVKLEFDKKTFGRSSRCVRVPVFIFLFNDLLVVTKRKNEDSYIVVDYCPREKVQAMPINPKDLQQPVVVPNTCRYLIYLTLFNNHQGSAVDMILNCALLSERTRWIEAIHSVPENKPCEVWEYDCPQVQCVRSYIAQQPDELSLQESDVVTIHRKMNDGWYEGRRLRDGLQGWFPASYTMDIPCSRARASNLRQCYRLLMLSQKQ